MLKTATYKEKFTLLKAWMPHIIEQVKKDLKNDHLRQDIPFCKKYLAGKNSNKITVEELATAYSQAINESENGEALGEFISNRWLLKNSELYDYFETELKKVNPDFTAIEEIEQKKAQEIVQGAVSLYGAPRAYLFSVLNSVVFPQVVYDGLAKKAQNEKLEKEEEQKHSAENKSLEDLKRHYEQTLSRLEDKYEKKLSALQKKYVVDTDVLKKQIASLQRKSA